MSEEREFGFQMLDSSSKTIAIRFIQQTEMDTPATETSVDILTLRSVDEPIKRATDPILRKMHRTFFCFVCGSD